MIKELEILKKPYDRESDSIYEELYFKYMRNEKKEIHNVGEKYILLRKKFIPKK